MEGGKVLVVGGRLGPATAQLYDPSTGGWSPTAPMKTAASLPTATTLPTGKVLVIAEGAPQLFDPGKGTWATAPLPPSGHAEGTATVLPNGKVLVAGGLGSERGTAAADIYDPATNSWAPTAPLIQVRSQHVAALLPSGKVLVAGGFSENYGPKRKTAELYDPQKGSWTPTGELAAGVVGHTATVLGDGRVLLAGGQSEEATSAAGQGDRRAQLYDESTGSWAATGEMKSGRSGHTSTLLPDGTVLAVGGVALIALPGQERPEDTTPAELYDPRSGTWATADRPGLVRVGHTATLLPEGPPSACGDNCGKILVAGGRGAPGQEAVATSAELYEAPRGSVAAPVPTAETRASDSAAGGGDADDDGSSLPMGVVAAIAVVVGAAGLFAVLRRRQAKVR